MRTRNEETRVEDPLLIARAWTASHCCVKINKVHSESIKGYMWIWPAVLCSLYAATGTLVYSSEATAQRFFALLDIQLHPGLFKDLCVPSSISLSGRPIMCSKLCLPSRLHMPFSSCRIHARGSRRASARRSCQDFQEPRSTES